VTSRRSWIDDWIHGFMPAVPQGLALTRIAFAAYFLFIRGVPHVEWVAELPAGFLNPSPLSFPAFMSDFPPTYLVHALLILFIFLFCGFRTAATSIALTLAWIVSNSLRYSLGKIDHDIMAVLTPAVMAFSGWGAVWSLDARAGGRPLRVQAWPLALLALLVAFGFLSAGVPKLLAWADFDLATQGTRRWLVDGWYGLGRRRLLAPFFMQRTDAYFWELLDLTAVAFETTFVLSLVRRSVFRTYLLAAVMFHVANVLMLNIGFLTLLPVYLVFAPWERLVGRLPARFSTAMAWVGSWRALFTMLILFAPLLLLGNYVSSDAYFTHLGVIADLVAPGFDFAWAVTLVVFPVAALVALAFVILP
jgi:hypothetical protein